jgi:hypothetical protein
MLTVFILGYVLSGPVVTLMLWRKKPVPEPAEKPV